MIEIIWHGRGGQGAFTAARLLGAAGSLADGHFGLAFPSFGPERRGAPMRAFTKFDTKPIGNRSTPAQADYVVYLDSTLFGAGWESELKEGGIVLVNTTQPFDDPRILSIDASGLSREILGRDIPNTSFLAAISVLCDALSPADAMEAIRLYMAPKLHAKNCAIVERVAEVLASGTDAPLADAPSAHDNDDADEPAADSTQTSVPVWPAVSGRAIPHLREHATIDPAVYAKNTCWEAGHLVSKNAGWRTMRPEIATSACRGCLACYMDCPDGTIYKVASSEAAALYPDQEIPVVAIDYDFCKGCGICAASCKFAAIALIPEQQ